MTKVDWPKVSVIIPNYNSKLWSGKLIDSLNKLNYPGDFEIIVVDNGSKDGSYEDYQKSRLKNFQVLKKTEIKSSYYARNCGIAVAKGDVFAFTDADCILDKNWLKEGIEQIVSSQGAIVAGKIEFYFKNIKSPYEQIDSSTNMDNEKSVQKGEAKTANIFITKQAIEIAGEFIPTAISGEDVAWTKRAVQKGLPLSYCGKAIVRHPTRSALASFKKMFRVGQGIYHRIKHDIPRHKQVKRMFRFIYDFLKPPMMTGMFLNVKKKGFQADIRKLRLAWWTLRIVKAFGLLKRMISL